MIIQLKNTKLKLLCKIRFITYVILGFLSRIFLEHLSKNQVIVLCYHSISEDKWRFGVPFSEFKKQINYLYRNYSFITANDFEDYMNGGKIITRPSVLLTFDDGYKDILIARSYLENKNIKPILFMLSVVKTPNRHELDNNKPLLNKSELIQLKKDGWTIGSHGATHADFSKLSAIELEIEVKKSKVELKKIVSAEVKYFAYPKGKYTKKVLHTVKSAKYALGFSMDDSFISQHSNKLVIPRIGVDRSHSFMEYKAMLTPGAILFRMFVKNVGLGFVMN